MLTTNLRFTQTLDPTGAPRLVDGLNTGASTVTAAAYRACATTTSGLWSINGLESMPKVDFHPDRWPLHSTS